MGDLPLPCLMTGGYPKMGRWRYSLIDWHLFQVSTRRQLKRFTILYSRFNSYKRHPKDTDRWKHKFLPKPIHWHIRRFGCERQVSFSVLETLQMEAARVYSVALMTLPLPPIFFNHHGNVGNPGCHKPTPIIWSTYQPWKWWWHGDGLLFSLPHEFSASLGVDWGSYELDSPWSKA